MFQINDLPDDDVKQNTVANELIESKVNAEKVSYFTESLFQFQKACKFCIEFKIYSHL